MDSLLSSRLKAWHSQIDKIAGIELQYFQMEASEKSLAGKLILGSEGKTISERESNAFSTEEWQVFKAGLALAKANYNNERRMLDLKIKAYEAEYLTFKYESEAIRKA